MDLTTSSSTKGDDLSSPDDYAEAPMMGLRLLAILIAREVQKNRHGKASAHRAMDLRSHSHTAPSRLIRYA